MNKRILRQIIGNLTILTVSTLILVLCFEGFIYFLRQKNLITDFDGKPSYTVHDYGRTAPWALDINKHFGVWHPPNTKSRHVLACFDVVYQSNSYGARDQEHARLSNNKRIVMLGDSFIEGFGVDAEKRVSNLLEDSTDHAHMNFGTSGNFGPTQYYLQYKHLVKQFDHDAIIIGMLPQNDFADDNPEFGKFAYNDRYRPYFIKSTQGYDLIYQQERLESSSFTAEEFYRQTQEKKDRQSPRTVFFYLDRYSYFYSGIKFLYHQIYSSESNANVNGEFPYREPSYSGYYQFNTGELDRFTHALTRLKNEAGLVPIYLFTIPALNDFRLYDGEIPPLAQKMEKISKEIGFEYIDLLPFMATENANHDSYFLSCNGHWSNLGNQVASDILQRELSLYER